MKKSEGFFEICERSSELDSETGYYYYGARYYNPRVSLWLNVDPLAEKYPSWSPYNYALQNPVRLIDPNGMEPGDPPMWNYYTMIQGGALRFSRKDSPDSWTIHTFFGDVNLPNPTATNFHILLVGFDDLVFTSHKQMAIYANAIDWNYVNETHHVRFNETSVYNGETYKIGKTPPTLSEIRDNVAAIQDLSCNCGAVLMGAMGASTARYSSVDDILENPNLLKNQSPADVSRNVKLNSNWRETTLGKGSNKGGGYKLEEVMENGKLSGRQIRYNPGSKFGRKGGEPYWRVINYHSKSAPIKGK